ncbi:MAG TPA: D-2-hydroxyacid dehydrogenase [Dehalococcoidia bacterium]|nr:D-2-hydroxyacid dehydrogenase [Dehalococcoidia bacterium]
MEEKPHPIKVLLAVGLDPKLLEDVRNVDPRLEICVLDRETIPLFWGRPPAEGDTATQERFASLMAGAEVLYGLIVSTEQARGILATAPNLRWFQSTSAGVDELIDAGFSERGVAVTTSSGVHATPIAEYALHLMLMFAKQAARSLKAQQERRWDRFTPAELKDATVGVVGLGQIGSEVARLAKGFGCRVLAMDRARTDAGPADELLPPSDLQRLLAESDYVVLSVPLSNETRRMIGEAELRAMRPSAVLINVCRGAVVDEEALVRALKEGRIAGAGLDVFEREPLPPESELWGMENVIISPHVSGANIHYFERAAPIFCENLRRYLDGHPLLNLILPERGY